uniref:Ankyrin repeat and SOCS box containing 8 n=1 Tax=Felis catus TaxID=9685 RepID=A0ABI8AHL9_FELCA
MSSSMWYIMQSIQSKYSLSERLIRTIAAIRSFPHDNVEDLIRGSMAAVESGWVFQLSVVRSFPLLL